MEIEVIVLFACDQDSLIEGNSESMGGCQQGSWHWVSVGLSIQADSEFGANSMLAVKQENWKNIINLK